MNHYRFSLWIIDGEKIEHAYCTPITLPLIGATWAEYISTCFALRSSATLRLCVEAFFDILFN
jgi:hypothetical protein